MILVLESLDRLTRVCLLIMNMWGVGRAYGYSHFKKSVPTENMGRGAAALCTGSDPCAAVVVTINNRNTSKQNAIIFRGSFSPAVADRAVRLLGVCFARVKRCAYWNISPVATLSLFRVYF